MRLRRASSVLRVSRSSASMLRWLKCDSSSWASSSMCRFFFLIRGEDGPVLRAAVLREKALVSDFLSSSAGKKENSKEVKQIGPPV